MKLLLALALVASASAETRIRLRSSASGDEVAISYSGGKLTIPQHTNKLADARTRLAALENSFATFTAQTETWQTSFATQTQTAHADLVQKHNHFIQVTYEDRVAAVEARLGIHRADINANDVDIANLVQKDTTHGEVHTALQAEDNRLDTRINNQKAKRVEGDEALTAYLESEAARLDKRINNQKAKRVEGDEDLTAYLESEAARLDTRINTQKAKRVEGDNTLTTAVDANAAKLESEAARLDTRINTQKNARISGDNTLTTAVAAEEAARKKADKRVKKQVADLAKATVIQNAQLQQKIKKARNSIKSLDAKMGDMKSGLLAKADAIVQQMETRADAIAVKVTENTDSIADLEDKVHANKDEATTKMQEETAAVNAEFARVIALIDEAKLDDLENHKKAKALVDSLQVVLEGKLDDSEVNTSNALDAAEARLTKLVDDVQAAEVEARMALGNELEDSVQQVFVDVAQARQNALAAERDWAQAKLDEKASIAAVETAIEAADAVNDAATTQALQEAETQLTAAFEAADAAQKTVIDAARASVEAELDALKNTQLPDLQKLVTDLRTDMTTQAETSNKAREDLGVGIGARIDTLESAQATEMEDVYKAITQLTTDTEKTIQDFESAVQTQLDGAATLADIDAARATLRARINDLTRDQDIGTCNVGTYKATENDEGGVIEKCVACEAGYFCPGNNQKTALRNAGSCTDLATVNGVAPTLSTSCKFGLAASGNGNTQVERCNRQITCKHTVAVSSTCWNYDANGCTGGDYWYWSLSCAWYGCWWSPAYEPSYTYGCDVPSTCTVFEERYD